MRKQELISLLKDVLSSRRPDMAPLARQLEVCTLTDEQLSMLQDIVLQEFQETGLANDGEPNIYGLRLDELIGLLAQCRMSRKDHEQVGGPPSWGEKSLTKREIKETNDLQQD
jgi:hypothetical protein